MILSKDIIKKIEDETGSDIELLGRKSVETAVLLEMQSNRVEKTKDYMNYLKTDVSILNSLIENIVVPKTWFFRNKDSFLYLKDEYLFRWKKNNNGFLKVLSIPCSTGEEPYSIAATLIEGGLTKEQFKIDAYDISERALSIAKSGVYQKRQTHIENLEFAKRFISSKKNILIVDDFLKDTILFKKLNLLNLDKKKKYDVVFCRNVFIYLNKNAREKVIENLKNILNPNGVIFTGHAEINIFLNSGFHKIDIKNTFACKLEENKKKSLNINTSTLKKKKYSIKIRGSKHLLNKKNLKLNINNQKKVNDNDKKVIYKKIVSLSDAGHYDEALQLCNSYIDKYDMNAEIFCIRGLIYQLRDNFNEAENDFTKAIYINPYYYEALLHMSNLMEKKGRIEKAKLFKKRAKKVMENESI